MPTSSLNAVLASEARLLDAMRTADADALDTLLHDDLLFVGPDGSVATKALDLANYRSGGIHLHRVEAGERVVREIGEDVVVATVVHLAGNYMGQEIDVTLRYLRVWQQFDARWVVVAGSVIPVAPSTK